MLSDDDRALLEAQASQLGATMALRKDLLRAMDRLPLCAICPAAQWYIVEQDRPHCFCTQFRGETYDHRKQAVTACDAREDALDAETPT